MSVSEFTKKYVRNRADYLCEYCHSPEKISASRFTIDHLQPRFLGGSDTEENLALACNRCNQNRYNFLYMTISLDIAKERILEMYQKVDTNSKYYGRLLNW